jgi:hypothetical protein
MLQRSLQERRAAMFGAFSETDGHFAFAKYLDYQEVHHVYIQQVGPVCIVHASGCQAFQKQPVLSECFSLMTMQCCHSHISACKT